MHLPNLKRLHYGALVLLVLCLSWLIADRVLSSLAGTMVSNETEDITRQADSVTESVKQRLKNIGGIPAVAAQDELVLRALARNRTDARLAAPEYAAANRRLAAANSS